MMKKFTNFKQQAKLLLCLLTLFAPREMLAARDEISIPEVIWCEDNNTLYFVEGIAYGGIDSETGEWAIDECEDEVGGHYQHPVLGNFDITAIWYGDDVLNTGSESPGWTNIKNLVKHVVIDATFAQFRPKSCYGWFSGCSNLTEIEGISKLNTSEVTNMSSMFSGCSALTSLDLSNFDTSKVTKMSSMFDLCSALTSLDVSNFDTSKVTAMNSMFLSCRKLTSLDVSNFDTSSVTTMGYMFCNCKSLTSLNLSNFDTSSVTNMGSMFMGCSSLTTIFCGDTWISVPSTYNMFTDCRSLVGGAGTAFNSKNPVGGTYAHPDGGTANPGYFTLPTPQAIWTEGNTTLTFIYGPQYAAGDTFNKQTVTAVWSGDAVTASGNANPAWYSTVKSALTKVVFHRSFSSVRPTSLCRWFASCGKLTAIEEISNLNTSEVTDMSNMFGSCSALTSLDVSSFNTSKVTNMSYMFYKCSALPSLDLSNFNTGNVTNMSYMFYNCSALPSLDLSNFNTSSVTRMDFMFNGCSSLETLDVSKFDTRNVTDMGSMFNGCSSLTSLNISNFNTSNVTGMINMFGGCESLTSLDVSKFDTRNVTSMKNMFNGCSSLTSLDLSSFDTNKVTRMDAMFQYCSRLTSLDLSNFVTSNATNMSNMFDGCSALKSLDLSNFNTSNVKDISDMFNGCSSLITIFCDNTWTATTSTNMFAGCTWLVGGAGTAFNVENPVDVKYAHPDGGTTNPGYFTIPSKTPQAIWTADSTLTFVNAAIQYATVGTFNGQTVTAVWSGELVTASGTSSPAWNSTVRSALTKVVFDSSFSSVRPTSLYAWFLSCSKLIAIEGISNLNTSEVTDMKSMFSGCRLLTTLDVSNFDTSNVTNMMYMFSGCRNLTSLDLSNFDTSKVTDMRDMFGRCSSLTGLDVSNFDTSNVTTMYDMFGGCSSLTSLDLSNFDTSKVTDMGSMFKGCSSLKGQDVSKFDTSSVTDMMSMFDCCSSLTSLDVSNFDISKVTDMRFMFNGCSNLTTIICDSTWTAQYSTNMFDGCTRLVGGAGTAYDASHIDGTYAHPDGGLTNPGYFTSSTEVITANKPGDKDSYWATYYYSGSNTVALPAEGQTVKIYTAEYSEKGGEKTLKLTEVTDGVIKAGQGVIIESTNQPNVTMKHSLTRTATDDFFAKNELKGRDHACALPTNEGTIYTMGNVGGQLGFYKYTGSQLKARRAYLAIPAGSEAGIRIRFDGEDTATGIDTSTKDKVQSTGIYDLQGRRVVNPTKGIYIVNGKKVYMK